jgi:hypothetical protein
MSWIAQLGTPFLIYFLVLLLLFMLIERLLYRYVMYSCIKLDNEVFLSSFSSSLKVFFGERGWLVGGSGRQWQN